MDEEKKSHKGNHDHHAKHPHHTLDENNLESLLRYCGHTLHHGKGKLDSNTLFDGLSAEEQTQLKTLLNKLIQSWKAKASVKPAPEKE
jgi:hypothetical protein